MLQRHSYTSKIIKNPFEIYFNPFDVSNVCVERLNFTVSNYEPNWISRGLEGTLAETFRWHSALYLPGKQRQFALYWIYETAAGRGCASETGLSEGLITVGARYILHRLRVVRSK